MKTKRFFTRESETMMAFMTVAVMAMGFTACSQDEALDEMINCTSQSAVTRGGSGNEPVTYVERSWDGSKVVSVTKTVTNYNVLSGSDKQGEIQLYADQWYVVKSSFECRTILAPVGRPANLIICDGATLTGHIRIDGDFYLNIFGQERNEGRVNSKSMKDGDTCYPAIGSAKDMGHLVIHGGNINANSDETWYMAGIGGGEEGDGGTLIVYDGIINAHGGRYGAGIGSGYAGEKYAQGGIVAVYGGKVKAIGGKYGAGIGGGQDSSGGEVLVYGGQVEGYGGTDAAGIGSGEEAICGNIHGGALYVYGGEVYADGTGWGAGIGGGEDADGAKVEILGGKVVAWAGQDAGKKNGSAIGSEDGDGHRGSLKLGDNMIVYAGQNPTDGAKHLFPFDQRVPACYFRPYARVEVKK